MTFEGPPQDVLNAEKELNSFLRSIQKEDLQLSKGYQKVLTMLRKQPDNPIDVAMEQYKATIHTDDQTVILAGIGNDVQRCHEILSRNIVEATIQVAEDEIAAFRETVWADVPNHLFMRCNGILHVEFEEQRSVINIVSYWEDMNGVLEDIKRHIKKNTIKEEFLEIDELPTRMIDKWMMRDLQQIERDFQSCKIQIKGHTDGFQITGIDEGLKPVVTRITQLVDKIITDTHTVTTPGMPYYFTELEQGISFIKNREDKYQVIINCEVPYGESKRTKEGFKIPQQNMSVLERGSHPSGVEIKAIVVDVTSHKVDAIVNAANNKLAHDGGLARAIADKGSDVKNTYLQSHIK